MMNIITIYFVFQIVQPQYLCEQQIKFILKATFDRNQIQFNSHINNMSLNQQPTLQLFKQNYKAFDQFYQDTQFQEEYNFTIHDQVFQNSLLVYTNSVYKSAPGRNHLHSKTSFRIYDKVKGIECQFKSYYDDPQIAIKATLIYKNTLIRNFFINCMSYGPKCVVDELFQLFHFILNKLESQGNITPEFCLSYMKQAKFKYINFENEVLDLFGAKTMILRERILAKVQSQLNQFLEVLIHTLDCLMNFEADNRYSRTEEISETDQLKKFIKKY